MPKLVKNGSVQDDQWNLIEAELESGAELKAFDLISVQSALNNVDSLNDTIGIWLASDSDANSLTKLLSKISVVAVNFGTFADGRSFSQARILRDHLEFKGEIRAIGNFIQDQMFYLSRCGVSEFSVADDADIESLQESLKDISESYQAGCDVSEPLFRRRA